MCFLVCLRISSRYFFPSLSLPLFKLSSTSTNIDPPLAWILSFIHDIHLVVSRLIFNSNSTWLLSLSGFTASSTLSNHFPLSLSLSFVSNVWYPYPLLFSLFIHLDFPPLQIFSFPFFLLSFSLPTFLTKSLPTSPSNEHKLMKVLWRALRWKPKPKLRNQRRFLSQVPWTVSSFPYSWYCPMKLFSLLSFYIEWTAKISWIQFGRSRYIAIIFLPSLFFLTNGASKMQLCLQFRNYLSRGFYVSVLRLK